MNILVIGGGGREHALSWALASSPSANKVFCAPGNDGMADDVTCLDINIKDESLLLEAIRSHHIDLVVLGPEDPLVDGLTNRLEKHGIAVFGPTAQAARLEGSKIWMKEFCHHYGIPCAASQAFDDPTKAYDYIVSRPLPIVIKTDALAAGKGVFICTTHKQACAQARMVLEGKMPELANRNILVEDHMVGSEFSFFALCDGTRAVPMAAARDYKRAYDGDQGPNTGGMGALSHPGLMDAATQHEVMDNIITPTIEGMMERGCPFRGVLFAGLMQTKEGMRLLEFNVRFGDPECQVLLRRLRSDLALTLGQAAAGQLRDDLRWSHHSTLCVVLASQGYPGPYDKHSVIEGLESADKLDGIKIFHAATLRRDHKVLANGGRVLGITAEGQTPDQARLRAYAAVDTIRWPGGFFRRDIGQ